MSITLPEEDRQKVIARYRARYGEHGYSPRTLGWTKGKQDVRFAVLTSLYACEGKTIIDVGCGFGDMNLSLRQRAATYRYLGIDLVPELIEKGRQLYGGPTVQFHVGDFLDPGFTPSADFAVGSGLFNFKTAGIDNSAYIEAVVAKAYATCRDGFAFDFLSDKVDFRYEHTHHTSPEWALGLGYRHSRNVVLRNDYMPFEFALFVFKDDSFDPADTLFRRFKAETGP